jgi:AAA+ superfamily predicted ATPase
MKLNDDLPREIKQAFHGRPWISAAELAKAMRGNYRSIFRLVKAGQLPCRYVGVGRRQRLIFTIADIRHYWNSRPRRLSDPAGERR